MTRRGVVLVELLVGLVLLGLLAAACARWLDAAWMQAGGMRAVAERAAARRTVTGLGWRELDGLAPAEVRLLGDTLRYRARRGAGLACAAGAMQVTLARSTLEGWRLPVPGRDSVLLPDSAGGWHAAALADVRAASCPDGAPGLDLALGAAVPGAAWPMPVRVVEWMELRAYESGGVWWLGARTLRPTDGVQPVAGPLASRGFHPRWRVSGGDSALELEVVLAAPSGRRRAAGDSVVRAVLHGCGAAC